MGNLTMTKIWHDEIEAFCMIKVHAASDSVSVKGDYNVADDSLLDLAHNLRLLLDSKIRSFEWKTGERGPRYAPALEIYAKYADMAKHIRFNIFMELEDTKPNLLEDIIPNRKYSYSFYIDDLENGPLYEFANKLSSFSVGKTISVY